MMVISNGNIDQMKIYMFHCNELDFMTSIEKKRLTFKMKRLIKMIECKKVWWSLKSYGKNKISDEFLKIYY